MQLSNLGRFFVVSAFAAGLSVLSGCGAQPGTVNVNLANASTSNANTSNNNANSNSNVSSTVNATATVVEAKEPEQYQAKVTVKLEAVGEQKATALPTLSATVARTAADRRMEFTTPVGGTLIFLDKGGVNYLILPQKKQYAELTDESLGFNVRRMLMPDQIVQQIKSLNGVQRVGEEKYNGRDVVKYKYAAVANTQTRAGQVDTDSFLLVDKETGLPLHSETVSQSSGGNVQGYKGLRIITEITDIKTDVPPSLFDKPADFQKIDAAQVRSQVDLVFNTLGAIITQVMQQVQGPPAAAPNK